MKTSKLLSLDEEIVQRLRQEENASELVNMLLLKHYKFAESDKELSEEEIIAKINDLTKRIKAYKDARDYDKARELENEERTLDVKLQQFAKIKANKIAETKAWEEEEKRNKLLIEARNEYYKITPKDKQTRQSMEDFLKNKSLI